MIEDAIFAIMIVCFSVLMFSLPLYNSINVIPTVTVEYVEDPNKSQIECLADNITHEAGNQPIKGKIAVSNVVMNRVHSGKYPSTPCEVIYQKSQFSWVRHGSRKIADHVDYYIAESVYYGSYNDVTDGSIFYHAKTVKPRWSSKMQRVMTISDHIFYKETT